MSLHKRVQARPVFLLLIRELSASRRAGSNVSQDSDRVGTLISEEAEMVALVSAIFKLILNFTGSRVSLQIPVSAAQFVKGVLATPVTTSVVRVSQTLNEADGVLATPVTTSVVRDSQTLEADQTSDQTSLCSIPVTSLVSERTSKSGRDNCWYRITQVVRVFDMKKAPSHLKPASIARHALKGDRTSHDDLC
jgi:hypothetical protein